MPEQSKERTLSIRGVKRDVSSISEAIDDEFSELIRGRPHSAARYDLSLERSAEADDHKLKCEDRNVVALTLEGGLTVYTSVERLQQDILPQDQARGDSSGELVVPRRIRFANQHSRGMDDILVEAVELLDIKGKLIDKLADASGKGAAKLIAGWLENKLVADGGLFTIEQIRDAEAQQAQTPLVPVSIEAIDQSKPVLIFIHGTASRTYGSFSKLWSMDSNAIWSSLEQQYGDNIFGFEHRTLSESPIINALNLVNSLPDGAKVHLVSHSRGGLVGELLCRGQFDDGREPFTEEDLQLFQPEQNTWLQQLFSEDLVDPDDYLGHVQDLKALNLALKQKQLRIQRFVRVACPARGTTLASGKLDLYLSAILNVIGMIPALKASPVYSFLKAFVLVVAKQRTRPEELPGLEAQMPGSPFIAMLNGTREASAAHLAVIEGDIEPTGMLKKIALFLVDRFYESNHDLVVNTPSMDGGTRRTRPIPVLFDQGDQVHHFNYFANSRSRLGLVAALTSDGLPADFQLRQPVAAEIARALPRGRKPGEVPVLFVLPGIIGSHIKRRGNRIWVDVFDLIRGRFQKLHIGAQGIEQDGPVASAYGDLIDYFGDSHEVIPFAYDWRCSILDSAQLLAAAVDEQLRKSDQPVRIIAHSMGGLVTRAMMRHEQVWQRMCQREGSRVLMLGTPNSGAYAIARLFALQDKFIKWLAFADIRHNKYELMATIGDFPGVLELLPVSDKIDFFKQGVWEQFAQKLGKDWQIPKEDNLAAAKDTWDELNKVRLNPAHVFYIAGQADETPVDLEFSDQGIRFFASSQGDGRVLWQDGIPKGIRHWFMDAVHGDMADHKPAFEALQQILEKGDTRLLPTRAPVTRAIEERREMLEDSIECQPDAAMLQAAALGASVYGRERKEPRLPPIQVSVCHGNLRFANAPLMIGHYQGDTIVSAEDALDRQLDGRLRERYRLGLYPGRLLTNEVVLNDLQDIQFPGTIIVGLGEVGELTPGNLTDTLRNALLRYASTVLEHKSYQGKAIRVCSLFIGTGSGGLSLDDAISAMMRAAVQANQQLAGPTNNVDRTIVALQFMELYEDVAVSAQHELLRMVRSPEFRKHINVDSFLHKGEGGHTRVAYSEDDAWWQRLRIETEAEGGLKFTALTRRARAEMYIQPTQRQSVEPFLNAATTDTSTDTQAGRVLFELLVPHEFKNYARDSHNLMLVLDKHSAAYPWELLEYAGRDGNQPLALQAGMLRQLASYESPTPNLCMNGRALVIGDPVSDFPELPGAQKEAQVVADLLVRQNIAETRSILKPSGMKVLSKLMSEQYQILHLAGHGVVDHELPEQHDQDSDTCEPHKPAKKITGMVIGPNHFLTPVEIRQMPATPELVFINCCHLGKTQDNRPYLPDRPHRLAANLATQLIRQGARAVIAAGWAVDDGAAMTFARRFYQELLSGRTFADAVFSARTETHEMHPGINTWGAYQCYGDPDYQLSTCTTRAQERSKPELVALSEYLVVIGNIAQDAKTATEQNIGALRTELEQLKESIPKKYLDKGELQAALGQAWAELDRFQQAIDAYSLSIVSEDGQAAIKAAEQLANMQARFAVDEARAARELLDLKPRGAAGKRFNGAKNLVKNAKKLLNDLNSDLHAESVERLALLGSACKRGAHIFSIYEQVDSKAQQNIITELKIMSNFYQQSYELALKQKGIDPYPLTNWLTANWLLCVMGEAEPVSNFNELLDAAENAKPVPELIREHFWAAISQNDCRLLRALYQNKLPEQQDDIARQYRKIRKVAASPRQFRSVTEHLQFLRDILSRSREQASAEAIERLLGDLGV